MLRVYTLIPNVSGCTTDWIKYHFPGIKQMGFDTVHFLPLTAMGGSESPYSVSDHFAIDPSYASNGGGMGEIAMLVNALKDTGLRGCFDLVLNHVAPDGVIARDHPEWIPQENGSPKHAGYQWGDRWLPWDDLVLIDYGHSDPEIRNNVWDYMSRYAKFWAGLAAQTGGSIRLDNLHSSHSGFVKKLLDDVRLEFPGINILAELFNMDHCRQRDIYNDLGLNELLALQWNDKFVPQLRNYLDHLHKSDLSYFLPISSHDSGSPTQEYGCVESTVPRYAVSVFFSMGSTGIVQGVEFGMPEKISFIGRCGKKDLESCSGFDFRDYITIINRIGDDPVFQKKGLRFVDGGHGAVLAAYRNDENSGQEVLVMANLDTNSQQAVTICPEHNGFSFDRNHMPRFPGYEAGENFIRFVLPPCGANLIRMNQKSHYSATQFAPNSSMRRVDMIKSGVI